MIDITVSNDMSNCPYGPDITPPSPQTYEIFFDKDGPDNDRKLIYGKTNFANINFDAAVTSVAPFTKPSCLLSTKGLPIEVNLKMSATTPATCTEGDY